MFIFNPMSIGYIYCFSNPCMPGLYKVGMTDRTSEERAKELYSTGVPEPFVIELAIKVQNPKQAESTVHRALESFTVRPNPKREYFRASIQQIKLVFDLININQIKEEKEIVSDNESVCTVISDLTTEADDKSVNLCTFKSPIYNADTSQSEVSGNKKENYQLQSDSCFTHSNNSDPNGSLFRMCKGVKTCEKSVKTCENSIDNKSLYEKYLKIGQKIGVSHNIDGVWGEWDGTRIVYENERYTPSGFSRKFTNTLNIIFVMVDDKILSWSAFKKQCKSV
jgi:hypothetical protein